MVKHTTGKGKGGKGLKALQRARRLGWLSDSLTEIAALEGRLMGVWGVDHGEVQARVYGAEYQSPEQKLDLLYKAVTGAGV